jgi:methyltransferase (TIGR00027 family)
MDFFNQLGTLIHQQWRSKHFEEAAFTQVATDALREMPPAGAVDPADIVRWAVTTDRLVAPQLDSDFGNTPVNVYQHERFSIEVVFGLDEATGIHQHGFSGAFHVLAGASVHSRYVFDIHERVNARLLLGALRLREVEYLPAGETRPIRAGSPLMHALFHLDRPSVLVVVRTATDKEDLLQYAYFKPAVAYATLEQPEQATRQLALLDLLREARHPDWRRLLGELIAAADFETAFLALQRHHRHLAGDELAALWEQARARHGRLIDYLPAVFDEDRRLAALTDMRRSLHDPDGRFLLALLVSLPDRASIFDLIRRRYDGDPADRILSWLDDLRHLPGADGASNVLGLNLNDVSLAVVRCLLEGRAFDDLKRRLQQEYDPAEVDGQEEALRELCGELRRSVLLRPLFVDSVQAPEQTLKHRRRRLPKSPKTSEICSPVLEWMPDTQRIDPVATTSRAAAAYRALESERPDRLFYDPWASALAGQEGFAMIHFLARRFPQQWGEGVEADMAIRTRFFDDLAVRGSREGVSQVVLVGAGMDSRAFRLSWLPGTTLYELDRPELLALKEEVLQREGARAGCRRVPLGADLEGDWAGALLAAGFSAREPSLWLAEGFFYYLDEPGVRHVLAQLSSIAASGSRLAANLPSRSILTGLRVQESLRTLAERGMAWRFGTDDPEGLLADHGWQALVTQLGEEGANYGRWPYPVHARSERDAPHGFLVEARRG